MRTVIMGLLLIVAALQYKLWLGDGSISSWKHLEKELAAHEIENHKLAAQNRILETEVIELKQGEDALEEQARLELGMIKDNETYYQLMD